MKICKKKYKEEVYTENINIKKIWEGKKGYKK